MSIPAWLRQHLIDDGKLNIGATRKARASRCPRCSTKILVGLDDDVAASTARVDPWPINAAEELQALISARLTYRIHRTLSRIEIDYRSHFNIQGSPPDTCTVVAEHKCGNPLGTPIQITQPAPQIKEDVCPF